MATPLGEGLKNTTEQESTIEVKKTGLTEGELVMMMNRKGEPCTTEETEPGRSTMREELVEME